MSQGEECVAPWTDLTRRLKSENVIPCCPLSAARTAYRYFEARGTPSLAPCEVPQLNTEAHDAMSPTVDRERPNYDDLPRDALVAKQA